MAITQENIEAYERKWDVDIEKQSDGRYTVTSNATSNSPHVWGTNIDTTTEDTRYQINVRPIEEDITINPDYAKAVGVELTGDVATDFANLNRTSFEAAEGSADFETNYPRFNMTHLHRSACVAAWLRSDGQVPPGSWHANPAFGASGAGARIEPGGGQGGRVSSVGPAHDTDHVLGAAANIGPMEKLGEYVSLTGELPHGMHGIPHVAGIANSLGGESAKAEYQQYMHERDVMPELKNIPSYDYKPLGKPGWDVDLIKPDSSKHAQLDVEMENHQDEIGNTLAQVDEYLKGGGDPEVMRAILEATEDGKSVSEDIQLAMVQERSGDELNYDSSNKNVDTEYTNSDDDYNIV